MFFKCKIYLSFLFFLFDYTFKSLINMQDTRFKNTIESLVVWRFSQANQKSVYGSLVMWAPTMSVCMNYAHSLLILHCLVREGNLDLLMIIMRWWWCCWWWWSRWWWCLHVMGTMTSTITHGVQTLPPDSIKFSCNKKINPILE